ncbi:unnamed protein product [Adineta steineri]|uniref:PDZ domain-containing protein n=1 Tax=Adineta steineri TaxID=433720 RepID=A0A814SUE8_9BILA|nr:unnamed protein product [Adineta steineri]
MAGTQTIKVTLQRDSLQTPWGFRLQGGADFRSPFTVNKITAGSPADGVLQRGDIILDIDQRPTGSMLHAEALELVQRAGGQITFLVQRGLNPLASFIRNQRPMSAMPWSLANTPAFLDKNFSPSWSPTPGPLNPAASFRNRPLERISAPKPLLSQTGSPLMPGPVPSVSTKTRGFIQPPSYHTERSNLHDTPPVSASYSPAHFTYPGSALDNRTQSISTTTTTTTYQNSHDASGYQPAWKDTYKESSTYIPSYQKKVQMNPTLQRQISNEQTNQRTNQQYTIIAKPQQQQQQQQLLRYRPASTQPLNIVHHQFNSPMPLYSNNNVHNVNHISRVSIIPSMPKQLRGTCTVALTPPNSAYNTANTPICYIQPTRNFYTSDF